MRRWLVLLSLLLASWQVLGAARVSEPCCDDPCDPVMACVLAACTVCVGGVDRALSAADPLRPPLWAAEVFTQSAGWQWASAPVGDIWKPPRKVDRFT